MKYRNGLYSSDKNGKQMVHEGKNRMATEPKMDRFYPLPHNNSVQNVCAYVYKYIDIYLSIVYVYIYIYIIPFATQETVPFTCQIKGLNWLKQAAGFIYATGQDPGKPAVERSVKNAQKYDVML